MSLPHQLCQGGGGVKTIWGVVETLRGFVGEGRYIYIPGGFDRVASPKIMSDCHMFRMNVCDAGRHAGMQRHKKGLTFIRVQAWLARTLRVQDRLPSLVPPQFCDVGHRDTKKG